MCTLCYNMYICSIILSGFIDVAFDGNAGPGLGQAQKCGRTHVYKQKIKKSANSLPLKRPYITFDDNLWS